MPIPTDTPARADLIYTLKLYRDRFGSPDAVLKLALSSDEDDAAALVQWLDLTAQDVRGNIRTTLVNASAEIREFLRARGR